ncbi:hypothetical protein JDV02_005642 [Purpureocillium takamizusanense]|uniref:Uncharacterized protein n=1 Tax=Purpureocillium takamizusanense TaxID=2060973 RepID=A0A9Q8VAJ5_9HYPO|nr:uncharacterized protein JDV02_005642 [Purpureocillium takamizusanense]UNI19460.1 hypothetical protein JDV02_005642 [Purpureocillium takamizusanense]
MNSQHSKERWVCDECTFESAQDDEFIFDNQQRWESHMRSSHQCSDDLLTFLGSMSKRTLSELAECPLCKRPPRRMRPDQDDHIAEHLHSWALRALPWNLSPNDEVSCDSPNAGSGSEIARSDMVEDEDNSKAATISETIEREITHWKHENHIPVGQRSNRLHTLTNDLRDILLKWIARTRLDTQNEKVLHHLMSINQTRAQLYCASQADMEGNEFTAQQLDDIEANLCETIELGIEYMNEAFGEEDRNRAPDPGPSHDSVKAFGEEDRNRGPDPGPSHRSVRAFGEEDRNQGPDPGPSHHSVKPATKAKSSSSSRSRIGLSFIFVVNRLAFYDPDSPLDWCRDKWMNVLPPKDLFGYSTEYPSRVMRYYDGAVTPADDYIWYRPNWNQPGYILQDAGDGVMIHATDVSSRAVFACNPHLPIVVIPEDPTTNVLSNQKKIMHALHFAHTHNAEGISFATMGMDHVPPSWDMLVRHLNGRGSRLIPSLVPPTYAPSSPPARQSRGLAGDLGVLLGMMAFSRENVDEVFLGRHALWRSRVWLGGDRSPKLYPKDVVTPPVGFLVVICLDPENPESTPERLHDFQWGGSTIVKEPSSSSSSRR